MGKNDFKNLCREFDNNVLDVVKQKGFYPYENTSNYEKFKEELPSKDNFYSLLTGIKKNSDKEYDHVRKIWNKIESKTVRDYHYLYLKCEVSLLAKVFEKFRKKSLKNYGLFPSYLQVPFERTSLILGTNA